jgi:hypothetical protein
LLYNLFIQPKSDEVIPKTPAETEQKPLAILFTNASGCVVFANRNFLHLTEDVPSRAVAGEQLSAILPIESRSAAKIFSVITNGGFIDKLPVSLLTTTGRILPTLFSGFAAYGTQGDYIGADIFLHKQFTPAAPDSPTVPALRHTGVLKIYVGETFSRTRAQGNTFMQAYVVSQIEMLQVLLARMGGPEARNTLERIVNEIMVGHSIPAQMKNGYLEFAQKSLDISAYRFILQTAIRYATTAIGRRIVGQEMLKVDSQMDSGLLQLLTQMDLRPTVALN